jgi:hypothetical protein
MKPSAREGCGNGNFNENSREYIDISRGTPLPDKQSCEKDERRKRHGNAKAQLLQMDW